MEYIHDAVDDDETWISVYVAQGLIQIGEFLAKYAGFARYLERRHARRELNELLKEAGEPPVDPKELVELLRSTGGL